MQRQRAPWWMLSLAASFFAYFALLVHADLVRPEPAGLGGLRFTPDGLGVGAVAPVSPAARAGLQPGDVLVGCQGTPIRSRFEWDRCALNIAIDQPFPLQVRRGDAVTPKALVLGRAPWTHWATSEGIALLAVRLVQLVTLALAALIVVRAPGAALARLGAWVLATAGIFCVVLPYRFAAVWRELPWPIGVPLWLPHVSSLAAPAILLSFFAVFPGHRRLSWRAWLVIWIPMLAALLPCAADTWLAVYAPARASLGASVWVLLVAADIVYAGAALAVLARVPRRLRRIGERRRFRVLTAGAATACVSGALLTVLYWWSSPHSTLLASPAFIALTLLLLACPLSFAYAILRNRLFDFSIIVRQGVRYALARRLLLSIVPVLATILLVDLYLHRDQALAAVVRARLWAYAAVAGAALLAQARRDRWLEALDRRFFRERYDASRLLRQVADEARGAATLERIAARVVGQIDQALHPRVTALLVEGDAGFQAVAAVPAGWSMPALPSAYRAVGLLAVLGRPLDLAPLDTSIRGQLPASEMAHLDEVQIEVLVPVAGFRGRPAAILALGARRSEEPYSAEDLDLLAAVAASLGQVIERTPADAGQPLFECPTCGRCSGSSTAACEADGARLVQAPLPRVLGDRYQLEHRLGRGGMGTVYRARDRALERGVAVKVLRADLLGPVDAAERFAREARASAGLSHPNVVTVHDYGVSASGHAFLVMELLEGHTLREALRAGPLPARRALELLAPMSAAIDAAHRRELVHRDIKPENVFLARQGDREVVKILDFGIAKLVSAQAGGPEGATTTFLGTPRYMAPEQLRGEPPSPGWDVWALAVVVYEMLTGTHPFEGIAIGRQGLEPGEYVTSQPAAASLPDTVRLMLARALSLRPDERPGSAPAFCAELEQALAGAGADAGRKEPV